MNASSTLVFLLLLGKVVAPFMALIYHYDYHHYCFYRYFYHNLHFISNHHPDCPIINYQTVEVYGTPTITTNTANSSSTT